MLIVVAALIVVGVVAYAAIVEMSRRSLATEINYKDILSELFHMSQRSSMAETEARESLRKLLKLGKKKSKALKRELEDIHEMQMLEDGGDDSEDEEEDDEDSSDRARRPHKKTNDKLADLLLAMQHRMRKAREYVEVAGKKDSLDPKHLMEMLDSNIDVLEKELGK